MVLKTAPTQVRGNRRRLVSIRQTAFYRFGYGGTIYLKAKTDTILEHYIHSFGAIPFSHFDPYLLLIDGESAKELFSHFLKEA